MKLSTAIFILGSSATLMVSASIVDGAADDASDDDKGWAALTWFDPSTSDFPSRCSEVDRQTWVANPSFSNQYHSMCLRHFGDGTAISQSLSAEFPTVQVPCLTCWGDAGDCGRVKCFVQCLLDQSSEKCIKCFHNKCKQNLIDCVGATKEGDLPPTISSDHVTTPAPARPQRPRRPAASKTPSTPSVQRDEPVASMTIDSSEKMVGGSASVIFTSLVDNPPVVYAKSNENRGKKSSFLDFIPKSLRGGKSPGSHSRASSWFSGVTDIESLRDSPVVSRSSPALSRPSSWREFPGFMKPSKSAPEIHSEDNQY
jgi:hypothetical protein